MLEERYIRCLLSSPAGHPLGLVSGTTCYFLGEEMGKQLSTVYKIKNEKLAETQMIILENVHFNLNPSNTKLKCAMHIP